VVVAAIPGSVAPLDTRVMTLTDEPVRPDTRPYACLFPRSVIIATLLALLIGAAGGVVVTRVWSDDDHPGAVPATRYTGDRVEEGSLDEPFTEAEILADDAAREGLTDDQYVELADDAVAPAPHDDAEPPAGEVAPEPDPTPRPEPENAAPTFDYVSVSSRSRLAALVFAAKDVDGSIARVVVDWGDGTPVDVVEPVRSPLDHRYAASLGNRFETSVSVTAYDDDGAFVSTTRAIEVVALQRVTIGDVRLTPRDDCFDVTIDLRLSGQAHVTGAVETGDGYRASLQRGDSAVVLAAASSDDRPVDAGFQLATSIVVDSSIHKPVVLRRSMVEAGSYRSIARLAHDDAPDRICTVDATYTVTVKEV
jgi:hypothetical protein